MRKETMLGWMILIVMLCAFGVFMYYIGEHSGLRGFRYPPFPFSFLFSQRNSLLAQSVGENFTFCFHYLFFDTQKHTYTHICTISLSLSLSLSLILSIHIKNIKQIFLKLKRTNFDS